MCTSLKNKNVYKALEEVLKEVQALRREVALFIPSESLDEYAHPEKIVAAYKEAIKKYPPYAYSSNQAVK